MVCLLGRHTRKQGEAEGHVYSLRNHGRPIGHDFPDVGRLEGTLSPLARAFRDVRGTWLLDEFQAGGSEYWVCGLGLLSFSVREHRLQFHSPDFLHDCLSCLVPAGAPSPKLAAFSGDTLSGGRSGHRVYGSLYISVFCHFPAIPVRLSSERSEHGAGIPAGGLLELGVWE